MGAWKEQSGAPSSPRGDRRGSVPARPVALVPRGHPTPDASAARAESAPAPELNSRAPLGPGRLLTPLVLWSPPSSSRPAPSGPEGGAFSLGEKRALGPRGFRPDRPPSVPPQPLPWARATPPRAAGRGFQVAMPGHALKALPPPQGAWWPMDIARPHGPLPITRVFADPAGPCSAGHACGHCLSGLLSALPSSPAPAPSPLAHGGPGAQGLDPVPGGSAGWAEGQGDGRRSRGAAQSQGGSGVLQT